MVVSSITAAVEWTAPVALSQLFQVSEGTECSSSSSDSLCGLVSTPLITQALQCRPSMIKKKKT